MHAIEVQDLRKSYGSFEAVRGISFAIPAGQVFAFLGPNGAGKTTTVEILEGYRERTGGQVQVLGFDPAEGKKAMHGRIGIVLQECGFPRFATVRELVALHATYYAKPRPVDEVIEITGLESKSNTIVRMLSGGQKRRLDLALALVGNPDLIFLDEPTTGFDPNARREAWDTIRNLRSLGKTVFLTTHYMEEAQYLADYVAVISEGKIVAEGPPATLGGRDVAHTLIRFTLPPGADSQDLPELAAIDVTNEAGMIVVRTDNATLTAHRLTSWAVDNNWELAGLTIAQPTLEDIYLELTKEKESL